MPNTSTTTSITTDITSSLDQVQGGAAGRAIANGAKAAWNVAKPWLSRGDKAIDQVSKYGGTALAAKEGYDVLTGGFGGGNTGGGNTGGGNTGGGNTGDVGGGVE